jgi:hypothetical protein
MLNVSPRYRTRMMFLVGDIRLKIVFDRKKNMLPPLSILIKYSKYKMEINPSKMV